MRGVLEVMQGRYLMVLQVMRGHYLSFLEVMKRRYLSVLEIMRGRYLSVLEAMRRRYLSVLEGRLPYRGWRAYSSAPPPRPCYEGALFIGFRYDNHRF